jgi:dTDP-4-amino-4,6-dideoxygalactose transaminase
VDIAEDIIKLAPDRPEAWIQRSFALHELHLMQEAFEQLLPAVVIFREVWTIPYNLACYCAQTGRLEECKTWLKMAMNVPLHDNLGEDDRDNPGEAIRGFRDKPGTG